jgi:hypothetical protein
MWPGYDPNAWRDLTTIRKLVALRFQTPTREWPLLYIEEDDVVLVIREWPDGSLTSYALSRSDLDSTESRGSDGQSGG